MISILLPVTTVEVKHAVFDFSWNGDVLSGSRGHESGSTTPQVPCQEAPRRIPAVNAHRKTRMVRWQVALALVVVAALADTAGAALASRQSTKATTITA